MKRRKVLIGMTAVAGIAVAVPGVKWLSLNTDPDLDYLQKSRDLLASIADTIIPKTDTPGGSECGVQDFVIKMVSDCTDIVTQNKFIEGLSRLESHTKDEFGKTFTECSEDERTAVLTHFEQSDKPWPGIFGKVQRRYLGIPFFVTLKRYCAIGYCTSEKGAMQGLRYAHIPGKYIACENYSDEKTWATS